jgi:hypothetical protein
VGAKCSAAGGASGQQERERRLSRAALQVEAEQQELRRAAAAVQGATAEQERANILLSNALRGTQHHLNVTKRTADAAALTALRRNEPWIRQKLHKSFLQAQLQTLSDQTSTLQARPPAPRGPAPARA